MEKVGGNSGTTRSTGHLSINGLSLACGKRAMALVLYGCHRAPVFRYLGLVAVHGDASHIRPLEEIAGFHRCTGLVPVSRHMGIRGAHHVRRGLGEPCCSGFPAPVLWALDTPRTSTPTPGVWRCPSRRRLSVPLTQSLLSWPIVLLPMPDWLE
jgi:hypothetical protein